MALIEPVAILLIGSVIGVIILGIIRRSPASTKWPFKNTDPYEEHQPQNPQPRHPDRTSCRTGHSRHARWPVGPRLFSNVDKSKVKTAETSKMLRGSLQTYRLDVGSYPSTEQGLTALMRKPSDVSKWQGPYLEDELPKDPWNNDYVKSPVDNLQGFALYSLGADGKPGGDGRCRRGLSGKVTMQRSATSGSDHPNRIDRGRSRTTLYRLGDKLTQKNQLQEVRQKVNGLPLLAMRNAATIRIDKHGAPLGLPDGWRISASSPSSIRAMGFAWVATSKFGAAAPNTQPSACNRRFANGALDQCKQCKPIRSEAFPCLRQ